MQHTNRSIYRALRTAREGTVDLRQRRQWFTDGDSGDPAPDTVPETQPAKAGQDGQGKDTATFTQADIDRIVGERAKRAEEATRKKLLEELGFDNEDALKTSIKAQREREEAEKTELEKLQAQLEAASKKAQEAEERAQQIEQQRLNDLRDGAIKAALKTAEKPGAVLTLIKSDFADDLAKVMNEDGTINPKEAEALAKKAEAEWPGMFASSAPGSQSHSGGKLPNDNKELERRGRASAKRAIKRGW